MGPPFERWAVNGASTRDDWGMIGISSLRVRRFFPPRGGISILQHIRVHLKADGSGLSATGLKLPDEKRADPGEISWAPGARDGAFGHHFGGGAQEKL